MLALLVVDVQNEFSEGGLRAVANHAEAVAKIGYWVSEARAKKVPIAWVQHHNRPTESQAFVPRSWGAELSTGMGPNEGFGKETLFTKDVYGAFTGTGLEEWLRSLGVTKLLIVGFFAHMCVSTSTREALVRGFEVFIDPAATGARDLEDDVLGMQTAEEVCRTAFLQLLNMGEHLAVGGVIE